jgi:dTDP-4-dehydrorhamnose 3,5-epimerase
MKFTVLPLSGAYLLEMEPHHDARGYFSRIFCTNEFAKHGLVTNFVQMSTSHNIQAGQIRGMHFQEAPFAETKIVRCTKGAILDAMIDLRPDSPTFKQWYCAELSATNGKMFYIPKGFAHGYKTLEDSTEIFYMMDEFYNKDAAREIEVDAKYFR